MTCDDQPQYAIAPGHDNTAGLQVLEGYTPTGVQTFLPFRVWGTYNPGVFIPLGSHGVATDGDKSLLWIPSYLYAEQLRWLMDFYCNGGYFGFVTIFTTTDTKDALEAYNASMRLRKLSESDWLQPGWGDYPITFILEDRLEYGELLTEDGDVLLTEDGGHLVLE